MVRERRAVRLDSGRRSLWPCTHCLVQIQYRGKKEHGNSAPVNSKHLGICWATNRGRPFRCRTSNKRLKNEKKNHLIFAVYEFSERNERREFFFFEFTWPNVYPHHGALPWVCKLWSTFIWTAHKMVLFKILSNNSIRQHRRLTRSLPLLCMYEIQIEVGLGAAGTATK